MIRFEITPGGWLGGLPKYQEDMINLMLDSGSSEEQIAELWLGNPGATATAGFGASGSIQSFFSNVKREFVAFICGDQRYESERKKALDIWNNQGKVGLVSSVSAVVASTVGLAYATIVPVIALLFSSVSKLGLNAFCLTYSGCDKDSEG